MVAQVDAESPSQQGGTVALGTLQQKPEQSLSLQEQVGDAQGLGSPCKVELVFRLTTTQQPQSGAEMGLIAGVSPWGNDVTHRSQWHLPSDVLQHTQSPLHAPMALSVLARPQPSSLWACMLTCG